jgi:hypothetical protein
MKLGWMVREHQFSVSGKTTICLFTHLVAASDQGDPWDRSQCLELAASGRTALGIAQVQADVEAMAATCRVRPKTDLPERCLGSALTEVRATVSRG